MCGIYFFKKKYCTAHDFTKNFPLSEIAGFASFFWVTEPESNNSSSRPQKCSMLYQTEYFFNGMPRRFCLRHSQNTMILRDSIGRQMAQHCRGGCLRCPVDCSLSASIIMLPYALGLKRSLLKGAFAKCSRNVGVSPKCMQNVHIWLVPFW